MINQKIAEEYTQKLIEITEKLTNIDTHECIHKKFVDILNNQGFIYGDDFKDKITSYFRAIFKNISCNSKTIYPKVDYYNPGITIGTYGIGVKRSMKADVVMYYDDIKDLIEVHKDKVIEGLTNHRKYKKAEEFEKFIKIISLAEPTENFTIDFKKSVDIIYKYTESSYYKFVKISIGALSFNTSNYEIYIQCVPNYNDINIKNIPLEKLENDKYPENVLNHFLFGDQLNYMYKKFEDLIIKKTKVQKKVLKELDNNFGKYIMALKL